MAHDTVGDCLQSCAVLDQLWGLRQHWLAQLQRESSALTLQLQGRDVGQCTQALQHGVHQDAAAGGTAAPSSDVRGSRWARACQIHHVVCDFLYCHGLLLDAGASPLSHCVTRCLQQVGSSTSQVYVWLYRSRKRMTGMPPSKQSCIQRGMRAGMDLTGHRAPPVLRTTIRLVQECVRLHRSSQVVEHHVIWDACMAPYMTGASMSLLPTLTHQVCVQALGAATLEAVVHHVLAANNIKVVNVSTARQPQEPRSGQHVCRDSVAGDTAGDTAFGTHCSQT